VFLAIPDVFRTGLAFVVVLGVLVFVHELGHYLAARWCGVHVEVFSIGFGRAIATWRDRVGTVWKLAWLPLGGYVKLHGQERPDDVSADIRASWIPGRTFHTKAVWARAIVVAAGPIANFLLAMVLFTLLFVAAGRPTTLPVVGDVLPDGAAARAGLRIDDRILAIGETPIQTFEDIQRTIAAHPAEKLSVAIRRGEQYAELSEFGEAIKQYQKALETSRTSSLAHYRIAEVHFLQNNYKQAANEFREALAGDLDPKWTEVWSRINLGKIFDITGQRERAVNEYNLAIRTKDDTQGAQEEAGKYLKTPYERQKRVEQ
jgi:RIP metalloprotease RseP